jgi:hypothetical protein
VRALFSALPAGQLPHDTGMQRLLSRRFGSTSALLHRMKRGSKNFPSSASGSSKLPSVAKESPPLAPPAPEQGPPGGLMGVVAEGFSFGIGSAIARRIVDRFWPSDD